MIPTIDYQQWKPTVQPQHLNSTIEYQQWKPTIDYQQLKPAENQDSNGMRHKTNKEIENKEESDLQSKMERKKGKETSRNEEGATKNTPGKNTKGRKLTAPDSPLKAPTHTLCAIAPRPTYISTRNV